MEEADMQEEADFTEEVTVDTTEEEEGSSPVECRVAFAYHSSKWAVRGMTKAAAVENGRRNVRVNSIHPGLIDTDMMRELPGSEDEMRLTRRVPLGRAAEANEVAELALYLASDESSYSTGSEFIVDGGLNAL